MFKFIKARQDYQKVRKILASCENVGQVASCMNLIHNYGKMYGYNHYWSSMDRKAWSYMKEVMDRLDYEDRKKEVMS
jgi:hypothetical protein